MASSHIYTIHESKDFAWFRLKALIWSDFGLEYPENLRSQSGNKVAEIWSKHSLKKAVILNCKGISVIDQHALEAVKKHIHLAIHPIVFISDSPTFLADLEHALGVPKIKIHLEGELYGYAYAKTPPNTALIKRLAIRGFGSELAATKTIVGECFERHPGGNLVRMHSTPLKSSGLFNARALIGNPVKFSLIVLQLADRLEALLQTYRPKHPRVLAVSLRGSPIAVATAFLANPRLDVEIIDHMGPKQVLLEGYSFKQQQRDISYIYIGDFSIGGTELKVASSYAGALGSRVAHALVIGTLLEPEEYGASIPIESLVSLRDCRKDIRYSLE